MGTPQSQGCSEPRNLIDANLSSFPEYLSQPILTYLGLPWSRWCPKKKKIKIMASLVALITWGWNS